jgi:hypothetical protein
MRKFILILLVSLAACTVIDKTEYRVLYGTRNFSNQSIEVFMYKSGNIEIKYQIASQELYVYGMNLLRGNQPKGSIRSSMLAVIDSVQIKFADGKIKTDYIQDYLSPNGKSIFRDEYYITENSCPDQPNCNQYLYTIDEQDYAEAK